MRRAGGALAALGALLVLTSSFAGWEVGTGSLGTSVSPPRTDTRAQNLSFNPSTSYSVESVTAFGPYLPLLLIVAGLLAYAAYLALRNDAALPRRAWQAAAAAAGATVGLGAIFVVAMLAVDPSDWWLDTGFFAGIIGGAGAAWLLRRGAAAT